MEGILSSSISSIFSFMMLKKQNDEDNNVHTIFISFAVV